MNSNQLLGTNLELLYQVRKWTVLDLLFFEDLLLESVLQQF
jgi:hypothetical protein